MVELFRRTLTPMLLVAVLAATVGCDRVTKRIAVENLAGAADLTFLGGTLRVVYAENTGGFLSLGSDLPPRWRTGVFVGATGALLVAGLIGLVRARGNRLYLLGATLFLAGGVSNWIDRLAHGKVVDFLSVGVGPLRTGVFNVADVAILTGLAVVLLTEFQRPASGPRHVTDPA
ncbi:MAG TPA: signal peptidase II [Vicinamibacterales bacterium]|jgi:signal peptidase II